MNNYLIKKNYFIKEFVFFLISKIFSFEILFSQVVDLPLFSENQPPRLVVLLWFCQKITSYLLESPLNVAVLHCIVRTYFCFEFSLNKNLFKKKPKDERNQLAFGACSLLAYHQIFSRVDQILQYYQSKRCAHIFLTMSQKRLKWNKNIFFE